MKLSGNVAKFNSMRTKTTQTKIDRPKQAEAEFVKLIKNVGVQGFHGTASVTVHVQDGHIQYTRITVDRTIR